MEVLEALAAERGLVELEVLDHRAHGAVEHENALTGGFEQCSSLGGNGYGHLGSSCLLRALGANAEQMADREHEIGAVHGVEMEGIDAALRQLLHLARGDGGRHQLAGL